MAYKTQLTFKDTKVEIPLVLGMASNNRIIELRTFFTNDSYDKIKKEAKNYDPTDNQSSLNLLSYNFVNAISLFWTLIPKKINEIYFPDVKSPFDKIVSIINEPLFDDESEYQIVNELIKQYENYTRAQNPYVSQSEEYAVFHKPENDKVQ